MRVLCMRHGDALTEPPDGGDFERCLSARGRQQAREVARALAAAGVRLDVLVTSPFVRAVQTAEIVAATLAYEGEVHVLRSLRYDASPTAAARALRALSGESTLAVGHMPTLPQTLRALLDGGTGPGTLGTAQVVCVEDGRARWTARPASGVTPLR